MVKEKLSNVNAQLNEETKHKLELSTELTKVNRDISDANKRIYSLETQLRDEQEKCKLKLEEKEKCAKRKMVHLFY